MKHFIKETDFSPNERIRIFENTRDWKRRRLNSPHALDHQSWGMLFFKKSTRTRVSFEVGIGELGGRPISLNAGEMQLSRGESVADTARVLSRYLHGLVIRCFEHDILEQFAEEGTIPVVNALTDFLHPCQSYADFFTLAEHWTKPEGDLLESLKGRKLAFFGDTACNVSSSLILGGAMLGMEIVLSGPDDYRPTAGFENLLEQEGLAGAYTFETDPEKAAENADVLYTDVWVSMGKEEESKKRLEELGPYQVDSASFDRARPDALFMHCLPAHAGHEVSQEVLDSPRSIIFDQAENRLHMQKAILAEIASATR